MKGLDIQIATNDPCPTPKEIKTWVKAALTQQQQTGAIVVRIVDEAEMVSLNHHYRKKEKPTNVLSFKCNLPDSIRGDILGDIVICARVVATEAVAQEKMLNQHWAHMVIHGVLHLLGYDHENEQDALVMENHEVVILNELGFADPYRVEKTHE